MKSDLDYAARRSGICFFRFTGAGRLIRVHRIWPEDEAPAGLERCSCNKFKLVNATSKIEWFDPPGDGEVRHEMCYINAAVGGWVHVPPPQTLVPPWETNCVCGKKKLTNDVPFRVEFIAEMKREAEGKAREPLNDVVEQPCKTNCVARPCDAFEAEQFFNEGGR